MVGTLVRAMESHRRPSLSYTLGRSTWTPLVAKPMTKRIVLQETQGPRAGMFHIMGCDDELGEGAELPAFVDPVEIIDRVSAASLIQSKARYVLYREVMSNEPT